MHIPVTVCNRVALDTHDVRRQPEFLRDRKRYGIDGSVNTSE